MRRFAFVVLCLALASSAPAQQRRRGAGPAGAPANGGGTTPAVVAAGSALPGLTPAQAASFNAGRAAFTRDETPQSGLGPVFNQRSCQECHNAGASGGGGNRTVTRVGRRVNGVFDPLVALGGSLIQDRAIGGNGLHQFAPERVPVEATIVAQRRTTPLFGLGFVDATPDATFVALAAQQAVRGDAVAGRVNMTDNVRAGGRTVGRFGWKAQVPSLVQFTGDALLNEMGITNPDFPSENCPQGNCAELSFNPAPGLNDSGTRVDAITNFMLMLAAPPRGTQNADTAAGEQLFASLGCGGCHVATLTTGASTIAALDRQAYHPYSDFLLHDMGSLGDGIEMASATGNEIRTAPLWGLRFFNRYLHDGRATTLDAAISAHAGQALASRNQYVGLAADAKAKLLAFLQSL